MADDFDEDINRDWFLDEDEYPKPSPSQHILEPPQDDLFSQGGFNQPAPHQNNDFDLVVPVEGDCGSVSGQNQRFNQPVVYQQQQGYDGKQDDIVHHSQPSTSSQQTYEINGVQYVQQPVSSQPQQFTSQDQGQVQYFTQGQFEQWDQTGQQFQIQYLDDQSNQGERQPAQQFVNVNNIRVSQAQSQLPQQVQIPAGQVAQQLLMPDGKVVLVLTQQNQDPQQPTGQYIQQQIATSNAQNAIQGQNVVMLKNGQQQPLRIVQQNQSQQQMQNVEMEQQQSQNKPETPTKKSKAKKPSKKQLAQMASQQQPQYQQQNSQPVQITQGIQNQVQYQPQQMLVMSPQVPVSPTKNRRPNQRSQPGQVVQVSQPGQMQRQVVVTQSGQQILAQPGQQGNIVGHLQGQQFPGQVVQVSSTGQPIQIQQMGQPMMQMQPQVQQIIVPSKDDIMQKMMSLTSVRFSTPEQSAEFGSVMTEIVSLPDNAPPEKLIEVSNRLDALIAQAEKETADSKTQPKPVKDNKPKPQRKPKVQPKPPPPPVQQQYVHQQGPSTSQPQIIQRPQGIQRQDVHFQNQPQYQTVQQPIQQVQPQQQPNAKKPRPKKLTKKQQQELERQQQLQDAQGRPVYVVQTAQGPVYTQNGQQIVFQYHPSQGSAGMGVPMPVRAPTPIVLPTPKELAAMVKKKQEQRRNKIACFFNVIKEKLNETDYISPFKGLADVFDRLLPFGLLDEPEHSEEHLKHVDRELLRHQVYMDAKLKRIENKMRSIYFKDAVGENEHKAELNMLLYLDAEYERRRFEADKKEAKQDLEGFLRESEIVRFGSDVDEVQEKMRALQNQKVEVPSTSTYEYKEFDEEFFFREIPRTPTPPTEKKKQEKRHKKPQFGYLYESDEDEDEEEDSESEEEEVRPQTVQSSSDESEEAEIAPDFEQPRAPVNVQLDEDDEEDVQFVSVRKSKSSDIEVIGEVEARTEALPQEQPDRSQLQNQPNLGFDSKPGHYGYGQQPSLLPEQDQFHPIAATSQLDRQIQIDREQIAHVQREIEEMKQMESQFAQSQNLQPSPNRSYQQIHSHQSTHPLSHPSIHAPTPPSRPQIHTPASHPHQSIPTPPSRQNVMMNTPPGSIPGYPGSVGKPGSANQQFVGSTGLPQMQRPGSVGQMGPPSVNQQHLMMQNQMGLQNQQIQPQFPHPAHAVAGMGQNSQMTGMAAPIQHPQTAQIPQIPSNLGLKTRQDKPNRPLDKRNFPDIPDDLANIEPFYAANGPIMPNEQGQFEQSRQFRRQEEEKRIEERNLEQERQKRADLERRQAHDLFLQRQLKQQQEKMRLQNETQPAAMNVDRRIGNEPPQRELEKFSQQKLNVNEGLLALQQLQKEQQRLVEQQREDAKRQEEARKVLEEQKRRAQANDQARLHLENVQKQRLQNVNPMAGLLSQQKELTREMNRDSGAMRGMPKPADTLTQPNLPKDLRISGAQQGIPPEIGPKLDFLSQKPVEKQPFDFAGLNLTAEMQRNLSNMNQEMNLPFGGENQALVNFIQSMNKSRLDEFQAKSMQKMGDSSSFGGQKGALNSLVEPKKMTTSQDIFGRKNSRTMPQNAFGSQQQPMNSQKLPEKDVRLGQTSIKGLKLVPQSQATAKVPSQEEKRPGMAANLMEKAEKTAPTTKTVDFQALKNIPKPTKPSQEQKLSNIQLTNSRLKTAIGDLQRNAQSKPLSGGLVGRNLTLQPMNPAEKLKFSSDIAPPKFPTVQPLAGNVAAKKKGDDHDTPTVSSNAQMPLKWRMKRELIAAPAPPAPSPSVAPANPPLPSLKLKIALPKKDEESDRKERKKLKKEEKRKLKEEKKEKKKHKKEPENLDYFQANDQPGPSNWNNNEANEQKPTPIQSNGGLKLKIRLGPKPEEEKNLGKLEKTEANLDSSTGRVDNGVAKPAAPVTSQESQLEPIRPLKMKIRLPKPEPPPMFEPEEEGPPQLEAQKVPKLTLKFKKEKGEEPEEEPKKKKKKHKKHKRHRSQSPSDENERPEKIPKIRIKALAPPPEPKEEKPTPSTSQNPFAIEASTPQFSDVEDYSDDERLCHLSSKLLTKLK
ncbi:unnamed protein product [Bursaphelenchus xylophilus]|uniref:(pine wood nematode) hypothetical protein n=1 Tax=Bursaphelenchus xylophilus TaxID=6326 RepID=A0A1I7S2G4_BURXY|nr:unnamed protein product [Bursaphelenchus xylophilus]CAG9114574.1 unnamed protein product [Bursaphelenchus xylophilus]